jgi:hypothetical protein
MLPVQSEHLKGDQAPDWSPGTATSAMRWRRLLFSDPVMRVQATSLKPSPRAGRMRGTASASRPARWRPSRSPRAAPWRPPACGPAHPTRTAALRLPRAGRPARPAALPKRLSLPPGRASLGRRARRNRSAAPQRPPARPPARRLALLTRGALLLRAVRLGPGVRTSSLRAAQRLLMPVRCALLPHPAWLQPRQRPPQERPAAQQRAAPMRRCSPARRAMLPRQ